MINNNPTTQQNKQNIKDFLTGTADLIFENQEKIPNGEYVELNRMIQEITIFNNSIHIDDDSDDEPTTNLDRAFIQRQFSLNAQQDGRIHELEKVRDKLNKEKRQLTDIITTNHKSMYSMLIFQTILCIIMVYTKS